MKRRLLASVLLIALGSVPGRAQRGAQNSASTPPSGKNAQSQIAPTASKPWIPPKTPWGDPNLQGVWPGTDLIGTPMERDRSLGTRAFLNDEEFAQKVAHSEEQAEIDTKEFVDHNPKVARGSGFITCDQDPERCRNGVRIGPPNYWDERGKPNRQASLVVDPPDGRIPPLTPEAQKLAADRAAARRARPCAATSGGCHDSWEDESLWDRCITRGAVGSIVPNTYNQGNQILQTRGYVVLRNEMIHEARIIPLDGRPHAAPNIRTWIGDSRGRWEGNTLVVETTNFTGNVPIGNTPASDALRLIERFTLSDANTLTYQVTVDDPKTWTKPWTISFPLRRDPKYQLFEYACHEGNYYMFNALSGARSSKGAK